MCAAITWMLRGFVPSRWALFGGMLVLAQIGLLSYWSQSYWGGALAAIGGALVFGALPRIVRRPARLPSALAACPFGRCLASGLLVLANTRPFEGALVSLARGGAAPVAWLRSRRRRDRSEARGCRCAAAASLARLGVGFAAIGWLQPGGHRRRLPHAFQPLRPTSTTCGRSSCCSRCGRFREYRHEILRRYFAELEVREIEDQRTLAGWATPASAPPGALACGAARPGAHRCRCSSLPWSWRAARACVSALAGVALLLVAVAVTTITIRTTPARRFLCCPDRGPGLALVVVTASCARAGVRRRGSRSDGGSWWRRWSRGSRSPTRCLRVGRARSANRAKASVERRLEELGGKHLVFVHHGRFADIHDEWVWNGADIDSRPIVFARAMTPAQDAELADYYRDRRAWRVEIAAERRRHRLRPNTETAQP